MAVDIGGIFKQGDDPRDPWRRYKGLTENGCMLNTVTLTPASDGNIRLQAGFDTRKPLVAEYIRGLMEGLGGEIRDDSRTDVNIGRLSCVADEKGYIKAIAALSIDKPNGRSNFFFHVITPEMATAIIGNELSTLNKKPSELGLCTIKDSVAHGLDQDDPLHYLGPCEITYPHSGVNRVEESAQFGSISNDKDGFEVSTKLFVNTPKQQEEIVDILKKVGFKVKSRHYTHPAGSGAAGTTDYSITIEGKTADQVMTAFAGRNDVIPTFIAKEIAEKAFELHPGQQAINEVAQAYVPSSMLELVQKKQKNISSGIV